MRPSIALSKHADEIREVLARFGLSRARVFAAARSEDTEKSDLDLLVDPSPQTTLYDLVAAEREIESLIGCKVEVLTEGLLPADIAQQAKTTAVPV